MIYPLHTPGPWTVQMMTRAQPLRYYVARQVEDGTCFSPHWEQLLDETGGIARFDTVGEAESAIARATGESA